MRARMPHMRDPQRVRGVRRPEADPQRDARPGHAPVPQPVGAGQVHRGHGTRAVGRVGDVAADAGGRPVRAPAPCVHGRPDRAGQPLVPGPCGVQPLLVQQHRQRLGEAEDVLDRGRAAPEPPHLLGQRGCARGPVPIGRGGGAAGPDPVREPDEGQTRRHHQPLLAGRDQHVHAPVVHPELVAAEARDRVHGQQRRMIPDGGPQRRDVGADARRGIDMADQHGAERLAPVPQVGGQPLREARGVGGHGGVEIHRLDVDPARPGRRRPAAAEMAGGQHQRPVAGGEQVGVRGLPPRMAVADIGREVVPGARKPLEARNRRRVRPHQLARIDVRRRPVHRPKHPVGHRRGAGNGKDGTAGGEAHRGPRREKGGWNGPSVGGR